MTPTPEELVHTEWRNCSKEAWHANIRARGNADGATSGVAQ